MVDVPAGRVVVGSRPGTPFRRPNREADLATVDAPAFSIDVRPRRTATGALALVATRAEADAVCSSDGARLCTELEWERACSGPSRRDYPGASIDACLADPEQCASEVGVFELGLAYAEWTSSDLPEARVRGGRSAVVRGARSDQPPASHRCAARAERSPIEGGVMAFRCCRGDAGPSYPEPETSEIFAPLAMDDAALRTTLASIPELARYAPHFTQYGEASGDRALGRGGATRNFLGGWDLATGAFRWAPSPGDEAWVIFGESAPHTLMAVLYPLADGSLVHGASYVFEDEDVPLAISRTPSMRSELHFTACAGCGGESGVIALDEAGTAQIIAR